MNDALPHDISDAPHIPQLAERDSSALEHARNTGANWGSEAASILMAALRRAPETSREKADNLSAEMERLKSLVAEAHDDAIAEEWHQAASSALRAGLPTPD